ncbi:hypothetical protein [Streptomyces sp. NPDC003006]
MTRTGAPGEALRPVGPTVAVQSGIHPGTYPPRCEFQYGERLRDAYLRGGESPYLAQELTAYAAARVPLTSGAPAVKLHDARVNANNGTRHT